jgi:hypothetical protein
MPKRLTTVTLRVHWIGKPPRRGTWIASDKGRSAFCVMETQETRVICARYDRADVPSGAVVHAWSEFAARKVPNPPAQRQRRVDHLRSMLRRGAITEREFAAAVRFRDTLERSVPAMPVSGRLPTAQTHAGGLGVDDRHLRARRAVERALAAVETHHVPMLDWVVLGNGTCRSFAAHVHTDRTRVADQLRSALGLLDLHYNPPVFGRAR